MQVTAKSEVEMRLLSPDGDTDGKNAETDSHRHGRKKFKKRKHQAPLDAQSAGGSPTAVETHTSARGKHTDATKSEHERVEQLANFQVDCIVKAMSFPNVQRISYSTCSVHVEENEDAVARVRLQMSPMQQSHSLKWGFFHIAFHEATTCATWNRCFIALRGFWILFLCRSLFMIR